MHALCAVKGLADVLTKGLHSSTFHGIISKLGMEDIYSRT